MKRSLQLRRLARTAVCLFFVAIFVSSSSAQSLVSGVEAISMTVSDMDRAIAFYSRVLTFETVSDTEVAGPQYEQLLGVFGLRVRVVRMRLGGEFIELHEYLAPKGKPIPLDSRSNDRWFQHIAIIVGDMDRAYQILRHNKVEHASSGPQRLPDWNKQAGGIAAFYFKDPDGHPLEILQFPPDKGAEKWHRPSSRVFLGIDHTAIVVSDTDVSLKFYRDVLGLQVVGESENYGTEQEHLNNVFGARLRITALRGAAGPGIELLEYLSPRDGRPFPPDERANDLLHRQTILLTTNAAQAVRDLATARLTFVSSGLIANQTTELGFSRAVIVRDPDGHAVEIEQK
ncbi:MAG: VOC family protein [Acidobacteria bacterium]|nr:VOC family protein [Acidobacteriota bacterium]